MNPNELKDFLSKDDVISKIIKEFSMLDDLLNIIIARYFVKNNREYAFVTLIMERLTFSNKLNILRKAKYQKKYKSLEVINFLERLSILRNYVAHNYSWSIHNNAFQKLLKRPDVLKLLEGFPLVFNKEVHRSIDRLGRLQQTKDFLKKR